MTNTFKSQEELDNYIIEKTFKAKKAEAEYNWKRGDLKLFARRIRQYLKETGGTFGVRVQRNNVIWISGAYSFGVEYSQRAEAEKAFSQWLKESAEANGLVFSDGLHKTIKFPN